MADFDLQIALDRLAQSLLPDDEIRQQKANAVAIGEDGDVRSMALARSLPWYRADVTIAGEAESGSGIRRVPFPQGGYLRHLSIYARVAPSSQYTIRITAGGVAEQFSLQAGMNTSMTGMSLRVDSGAWVYIDVLNAGGAEDVEITMLYSVVAGGTGGSGGSSGGGGGTAVWGEIGGTLLHQADLSSALAGKASVTHDHDGTYSPATHTHSVSDLTATGTRNDTTILYGDNTWKTAPSGGGGVTDHTALTNIGTNTHAQIDTHIASTSNPHSVTKVQVGLSNVPNTDFTAAVAANTAKISFDSTASTKLAGIAAGAEVNVNADWNAASGDAQILNKPTSFAIGNTYYGRSNSNPGDTSTTAVSAAAFSTSTNVTTVTLSTLIPEVTTGTWDVLITAFGTMYRSVSTGGTVLAVGDSTTNSVALGRLFPQTGPTSLTAAVLMKGMAPSGTFEVRFAGVSTAGTTYMVAYGYTVSATRRT